MSNISSAISHQKNVKPSWSWLRCFLTRSTTGSWKRPLNDAKGCPMMTQLGTKPTTRGRTEQMLLQPAFELFFFLLLKKMLCSVCRWLCYCNVPQFCDSLPRYETTQIFGRTLLRSVFTVMRKQLLEQARQEKDKLPPEKRTLILTHFPK